MNTDRQTDRQTDRPVLVADVVVVVLRIVSQTPPTLHPCTLSHGPTSTTHSSTLALALVHLSPHTSTH